MTHIKSLGSTVGKFLLLILVLLSPSQAEPTDEITIQRLTWAGVKVVSGNTTLLIDAVGKDLWDGNAPGGLIPVEIDTRRVYALVTHAHNDHFDVDTLKSVLGDKGYVICHESQATYIASRGLRVIPATTYEPVARGGFIITALPAMDGFGDHQVSWLITQGDRRIFHGGDTLWHGAWKLIGDQFSGIDFAFLPINGAVVASEPAISTAAVMTPSQAVDAALLLKARTLVPIHYGLDDPPYYVETPDALSRVVDLAQEKGVTIRPMKPGDRFVIE
jgi:L-ascorbate metabolism protein UlaG (beta-lactamase superfamily)